MLDVVPFLSYVLVATFTPGPNNIMAMTNANRHGLRRTIPFSLGVFAGFAAIMLMCAYFDLMLFNLLPRIQPWMELLAAAYMAYLAFKVLRSTLQAVGHGPGRPNSFVSGMVLQFVNPKVIIYGITVLSSFILPHYRSGASLVLLSLALALVGFTSTVCWALFGSLFQRTLSRFQKPFNISMALLLLYSAVSVFM